MNFLRDVKKEFSKVRWLPKKDVLKQLLAVNVVSVIILLYFGLIDVIINQVKNFIF